jgi:hypothetical protein
VQRCDRDDEVEAVWLEGEGEEVTEGLVDLSGRVLLSRELDAVFVDVDGRHVGYLPAQLPRQDSLAAADVERALAALWRCPEQEPVIVDAVVPPFGFGRSLGAGAGCGIHAG